MRNPITKTTTILTLVFSFFSIITLIVYEEMLKISELVILFILCLGLANLTDFLVYLFSKLRRKL